MRNRHRMEATGKKQSPYFSVRFDNLNSRIESRTKGTEHYFSIKRPAGKRIEERKPELVSERMHKVWIEKRKDASPSDRQTRRRKDSNRET
jgi:hypothetical protein